MYAKDETGAYNLLPIKEQCGVVDPYVSQYGALVGTMRDYTYHDTCACVKNPRKAIRSNCTVNHHPCFILFRGHQGAGRGGGWLLDGGRDVESDL